MDDQIAISSDSAVSDDDSDGIINTKVSRLLKTKVIKKETPMIFKV